ncbi:hypothetical protein [Winogradskyella bathintestinalis]|uniref:Uncharacterized protein n=1 Tax=Winogradskyella bathintestinalis TaxID=3035208 RepID=A0ABT7ZQP0_9FLAO|nr:hypothetical protein [Winogradskyella bathintestinalis]MDN3491278.1 hypothetical protein [Winogradskyella bathintestinalis]
MPEINPNEEIEKLLFLIQTSKERIDRLFSDKFNIESKAGVLIGFGAIFFTFKIALEGTNESFWFIPLLFFLVGLILIIFVIKPNKFGVGTKEQDYDELFELDRVKMLTKILKDNRASIIKNTKNLKIIKLCYGWSVIFIIISILLSFFLNGIDQNHNNNQKQEKMIFNYYCSDSPNEDEENKTENPKIDISPSSEDDIDVQSDDESDKK